MKIVSLRAAIIAGLMTGCAWNAPAAAQDFSLNSENLASLEEPLATDIGGITLELTGLVDGRLVTDLDGDAFSDDIDVDPGLVANFQLTASTQLGNRWNVGVAYFGQYVSDPGSILDFGGFEGDGHYSDNIAGFVGTSWGTFLGGEVSDVVREETRRRRGVGNSALAFDQTYGRLSDWGGAYVGQFGPARISGVVDEDGNFDLGFSWSRPLGTKDWRFTARYTNAEYLAEDGITWFDTQAVTGTASFIYGSSVYSLGAGYERLDGATVDANRWFVSAGWQTKTGPWSFSLEGHYGQVDGQSEFSAAAGVQYDLARGLSINLGINHANAHVDLAGIPLVDREETQAVLSLRYSF